MALELSRIIWLEDIVEKLRWKHNVEETEVIEVLESHPRFVWKEAGFVPGEDIYAAFGSTNLNRPLSVFFVYSHLFGKNPRLQAGKTSVLALVALKRKLV